MTTTKTVMVFTAGVLIGSVRLAPLAVMRAQGSQRVFELRTYTAPEGKLGALEQRFRDHTRRIFKVAFLHEEGVGPRCRKSCGWRRSRGAGAAMPPEMGAVGVVGARG